MAMPSTLAYLFSSFHWRKNCHCRYFCSPIAVPSFSLHSASASGSRLRQRLRPLVPALPLEVILQGHEQGEVVQPEGGVAEAARTPPCASAGPRRRSARRPLQQAELYDSVAPWLDPLAAARSVRRSLGEQVTLIDQRLQADQQRIPRERGIAGIGRVAVGGGAERQNLPERLPRTCAENRRSGAPPPQRSRCHRDPGREVGCSRTPLFFFLPSSITSLKLGGVVTMPSAGIVASCRARITQR